MKPSPFPKKMEIKRNMYIMCIYMYNIYPGFIQSPIYSLLESRGSNEGPEKSSLTMQYQKIQDCNTKFYQQLV